MSMNTSSVRPIIEILPHTIQETLPKHTDRQNFAFTTLVIDYKIIINVINHKVMIDIKNYKVIILSMDKRFNNILNTVGKNLISIMYL